MVGVVVGTATEDLGIQLCRLCVNKENSLGNIKLQAGGKCVIVMHTLVKYGLWRMVEVESLLSQHKLWRLKSW